MLKRDTSLLMIIDMQEKLLRAIHGKDGLVERAAKLVRGCIVLGIPVLWFEQYPQGLGPTVPEIADLLSPGHAPITKNTFSCIDAEGAMETLRTSGRTQVILAGIETHVCVYQTAAGLMSAGFSACVAADCVSSRRPDDKEIGLDRIRALGGEIGSYEMILFELLGKAEGPQFKEILSIVK